jgi:glucan biosynthesis protein C
VQRQCHRSQRLNVKRSRANRRFAGLDAWRTALMLGGPVLHGSILHGPHLLFQIVEIVSGAFRMGVFFSISGLLAGFGLRRRTPRAWFARHATRVGVPALFGLAVLCPLTSLVLQSALPPVEAAKILLFDWYHFWFLYGLLAYGGLTYLSLTLMNRRLLVRSIRLAKSAGQGRVLFLLSAAGFLLMFVVGLSVLALVPDRYQNLASLLRVIAAYAPLYGFGVLMAFSSSLRASMLKAWRLPATVLACTAILYLVWYGAMRAQLSPEAFARWDSIVTFAGATICPPSASLLILRSAMRVRGLGRWAHRLCSASFTLYMLHLPLLAAINAALLPLHWNYLLEYGLAVAVTIAACLVLHFSLVQRSPWLTFLLNGQRIDQETMRSARPGKPRPPVEQRS